MAGVIPMLRLGPNSSSAGFRLTKGRRIVRRLRIVNKLPSSPPCDLYTAHSEPTGLYGIPPDLQRDERPKKDTQRPPDDPYFECQNKESSPTIGSLSKATTASWFFRSRSSICCVVQLPSRIQITLGGNPRSTLMSLKSESFVAIV